MSLAIAGYAGAGALVLAALAGFGGYGHGLDVGRQRERAATFEQVNKANEARDRLRVQIEEAAIRHMEADQNRQSTQREIVRESVRIVDRPVYRNQCIDGDGVRLLDRAADNANGDDPAAPADAAGKAAEG